MRGGGITLFAKNARRRKEGAEEGLGGHSRLSIGRRRKIRESKGSPVTMKEAAEMTMPSIGTTVTTTTTRGGVEERHQ